MRTRKTVKVSDVVELANQYLQRSEPTEAGKRFGVASLLEQILFRTGNYRGYLYTDKTGGDIDESRRRYLFREGTK